MTTFLPSADTCRVCEVQPSAAWRFFPNASHVEQHENRNQSTFVREERTSPRQASLLPASDFWRTVRPSAAENETRERSGHLSRGDAALLRFAAAAEILETDFWVQYNELCGIPDSEVPGGTGNPAFTAALSVLDADMAQYVHDNTDDEFTHQNFLNAYLASKGADPVNLEPFRTLPEAPRPAPAENNDSQT